MRMRISILAAGGSALAALLLLTGCGGGKTKAVDPGELAFKPIGANTVAVVIDPNVNVPKAEAAFRGYCAGKADCTVLAWTDAAAAASRLPISDPEDVALVARYIHRAIGQDEIMWDCVRFRAAKAPCLVKA